VEPRNTSNTPPENFPRYQIGNTKGLVLGNADCFGHVQSTTRLWDFSRNADISVPNNSPPARSKAWRLIQRLSRPVAEERATYHNGEKVISQPNSCRRASYLDVLLPESIREFFRCKILRPLLRLLRGGVTPRRLAWSLALGIVIGINPSVGLTTLVVILLAWTLGLNQIASQIGVHAVALPHSPPSAKPAADRASQPSSVASRPRHLAVGVACADRVGHCGCGRDATARFVHSTRSGGVDASQPNANAFAPRSALIGIAR
jgi:Uncharacterized protein conserved in bacteria (DUF2062)